MVRRYSNCKMRKPPPLYGIPHCLKLPYCLKTCPHAKKNLNFITQWKFTLKFNKDLSEMTTCCETNYSQEVLILKESTEQNFDLGTNTLLKQIIFFLGMSTSFLSQN